jgi:hypothetical protein
MFISPILSRREQDSGGAHGGDHKAAHDGCKAVHDGWDTLELLLLV